MRGRSIRMLAAATVLSAVMVDGAVAQTPAPPTLGGGRLPAIKPPPKGYRPTVTLSLQPRGGKIGMLFDSTVMCTGDVLDILDAGETAWDGTNFSFKGRGVKAFSGGRLHFRWTLKGRLSGDTARGKLHVTARQRSHKCNRKPNRPFAVRVAGPRSGAPAKPAARGFFAGTSDLALFEGILAPVMLRVSKDGRKVAAQWTMDAACGKPPAEHLVNFTPAMRLRPDGSFSRSERFTLKFTNAVVRYRPAFTGRFTADGATGTLRLRARVYGKKGKKLITRCDSGVRNWNAAPVPGA